MKVFGVSQEGDKALCIVRDSGTDRRSVPSTVRMSRPYHFTRIDPKLRCANLGSKEELSELVTVGNG